MTRSLIRWNPKDMINSPMSRLFDTAFNEFLSPTSALGGDRNLESWAPAVDISEDDEAIRFFVEMPGLTKKDVEITLEDRTLTLRGERKFERDEEHVQYHRIERAHGVFSRTFQLPTNVNPSEADASVENGVLTVTVPKSAEAKPKRIEIR